MSVCAQCGGQFRPRKPERRFCSLPCAHQASSLLGTASWSGDRWWEAAACLGTDPELFFPARGDDTRPAKAICARCPVLEQCRDWGLAHERFGIFGGLTQRERQAVRRAKSRQPIVRIPA